MKISWAKRDWNPVRIWLSSIIRYLTALAFLVRVGAAVLMVWTVKQAWTPPTEDDR